VSDLQDELKIHGLCDWTFQAGTQKGSAEEEEINSFRLGWSCGDSKTPGLKVLILLTAGRFKTPGGQNAGVPMSFGSQQTRLMKSPGCPRGVVGGEGKFFGILVWKRR